MRLDILNDNLIWGRDLTLPALQSNLDVEDEFSGQSTKESRGRNKRCLGKRDKLSPRTSLSWDVCTTTTLPARSIYSTFHCLLRALSSPDVFSGSMSATSISSWNQWPRVAVPSSVFFERVSITISSSSHLSDIKAWLYTTATLCFCSHRSGKSLSAFTHNITWNRITNSNPILRSSSRTTKCFPTSAAVLYTVFTTSSAPGV